MLTYAESLPRVDKMVNNLNPDSVSGLVQPYINGYNPYNLRNNDDIRIIYARTNLYYNSFLRLE